MTGFAGDPPGYAPGMDRANSKHAAWIDDKMARETEGIVQGQGAGSRAEEWREAEPAADERTEAATVPDVETDDEGLSRLGRYVPRTTLPGDRAALINGAERMHAPDDVLALLDRLPSSDHAYATVAEVWAALGHPLDRR